MAEQIITGFHAIEERVLSVKNSTDSKNARSMKIFYSKPGPRIKKILEAAKQASIETSQLDTKSLDNLVKNLPPTSRDHRGIVLCISGNAEKSNNIVNFDEWILESASKPEDERQTVVILDSVTDPHNVGAIIRSCDQFGAALLILPERRGANDISGNEVIARASAGASAWVPIAIVPNLVRAAQKLKENGFWIYGADAGGTSLNKMNFSEKTVLIMGSEGNGIARLLQEQCDCIVSIPTQGKIDSLNVSVAAGVLLYEISRQA